ncbi:hypothetical protein IW150_002455 [Coemansia sp. RSA 2607]|nr:hypothetical protein IW150_002455 [Coemansia sp. RSA 2607]
MSLQPIKQQEKGGSTQKQDKGSVSLSGEPVGESQHEAGKVVTVERMQKMERWLDNVCALLEALMTGCRVGEGAGLVEYTPSPGGVLSRFEYHEQLLYGKPGTAIYGQPPFAGGEGSAPGNPRIRQQESKV